MLNFCWFKHKKICEYFKCFWKVFCSLKLINFKNHFCPILATLSRVSPVACHSRKLAGQFWRLVHEWKVQSRGLHRNFRDSARDSLASRPSSREKHLEIFFKILSLSVLAAWPGNLLATHFNREKCVFAKIGAIFKSFLVFPRTICDYSSFLSTVSFPNAPCNHFQTPLLLPFKSKSSSNRYGFSFSNSVLLDFVFFPLEYSHLCLFWDGFLFRLLLLVHA